VSDGVRTEMISIAEAIMEADQSATEDQGSALFAYMCENRGSCVGRWFPYSEFDRLRAGWDYPYGEEEEFTTDDFSFWLRTQFDVEDFPHYFTILSVTTPLGQTGFALIDDQQVFDMSGTGSSQRVLDAFDSVDDALRALQLRGIPEGTLDECGEAPGIAVMHIPHSSTYIPDRLVFSLDHDGLAGEVLKMTDRYTDQLFFRLSQKVSSILYPVSRLVVDPERFVDDHSEQMASKGMGVIYTATADGRELRRKLSDDERNDALVAYYEPHHARLSNATAEALARHGCCLVIDSHSFPSRPLPYEDDQSFPRPEICLGTDGFHTPEWLVDCASNAAEAEGWQVALNKPFAGCMVPADYFNTNQRVWAIMIEVRRDLYMDEGTGEKLPQFEFVKSKLSRMVDRLVEETIQHT
jgi:N-formylglutamate deformylase